MPTYKSNTGVLEIGKIILFTSVVHVECSRFKCVSATYSVLKYKRFISIVHLTSDTSFHSWMNFQCSVTCSQWFLLYVPLVFLMKNDNCLKEFVCTLKLFHHHIHELVIQTK